MSVCFLTLPVSHFCERSRWVLDMCGIEYDELCFIPPFHRFSTGGNAVPTLLITSEDGSTSALPESNAICYWACQQHQKKKSIINTNEEESIVQPSSSSSSSSSASFFVLGPPLSEEHEMLLSSMGVAARRLCYRRILPDTPLALRALGAENEKKISSFQRTTLRWTFSWGLRPLMRKGMKIEDNDEDEEEDRHVVQQCVQQCEKWLDHLHASRNNDNDDDDVPSNKTQLTHWDLSFCSLASPLVCPPEMPVYDDLYKKAGENHPLRVLVDEYRATRIGKYILGVYARFRNEIF